jgi:hypothetical protein
MRVRQLNRAVAEQRRVVGHVEVVVEFLLPFKCAHLNNQEE